MIRTLDYARTYSFFEPTFTYNVRDLVTGQAIGAVARNVGGRRWYASNRSWSGGGDLVDTFATRHDAAVALRFIANGTDPAVYGGYSSPEVSA